MYQLGQHCAECLQLWQRQGYFIVYNPDKQQFVSFIYSAMRADRQVLLQLPNGFSGDVVHCYMFFANEKGDRVSTSQYLGEMFIEDQLA